MSADLNIPTATQTWPANAFSLVVASFLLVFGRLADIYGGYPVYIAGIVWLFVWSIVAANAQNELMMDFCRALQGLGPAAYLPSSLMLLGSIYRPGPRKNLIFSIYGAMAPLGFYIGIFFAGVTAQFTTWRWYFYIGAILTAMTGIVAFFSIPSDIHERRQMNVKMDWAGSGLISCGLILVVFAVTDSSHAPNGWATWYIIFTLIVGLILLSIAVYVEGWVAEAPLLPPSLFKVKHMTPLIFGLLLSYGTLGVFLLYSTYYMTNIMGGTPMQLVAWFTPMALGGCIIATVGGLVLHIIPGTVMLIISGAAWIVAPLMFAIMPVGGNYWAFTFPSMIAATIAIDVNFNVSNIFISTSLPLRQQGLGGALVNSILQLGIAISLGFADVVAAQTADQGQRKSYKAVFWFEVAEAAIAQVILLGFVRIQKAQSQLTVDELAELQDQDKKQSHPTPAAEENTQQP